MKSVLGITAFRRLLATWVLNELATSIAAVALAVFVYRRTGSAIGAMAFFLCTDFGPALISPWFVARLDQRSARRVLGLLYVLETFIFVVLAWLTNHLSVASILVLAFTYSTLGVIARVLARSAWTSVTRPVGLLREASAAMSTALSVCYMAGPAIGGVVVAAAGVRTALLVCVGAFVWIVLIVASTTGLPLAVPNPPPARGRLRAAISYTWRETVLRRLLGLQAVAMLFFSLSIPVEVVLAQHTLKAGASGYGALLSAWGAGGIIGTVAYGRWRAVSDRLLITAGTILLGLGFLVMALAPTIAIAVVGAVICGIGNGLQVVSMRTALQEVVSGSSMALVLSLSESTFQAVPGAGIVLGGVITALAGARIALATGAAGSFLVAGLMWLGLAAVKRTTLEEPEPSPAPEMGLTAAARRS
jgi:predicted MFS family arabinose efflux permease